MIKIKCVCGYCDDYMEMDNQPVVALFHVDDKVRGIRVTNYEGIENKEIFADLVIPESLALVIENWIKENNDKE